jgi:hypothetical protein
MQDALIEWNYLYIRFHAAERECLRTGDLELPIRYYCVVASTASVTFGHSAAVVGITDSGAYLLLPSD